MDNNERKKLLKFIFGMIALVFIICSCLMALASKNENFIYNFLYYLKMFVFLALIGVPVIVLQKILKKYFPEHFGTAKKTGSTIAAIFVAGSIIVIAILVIKFVLNGSDVFLNLFK